MKKRSRLKINAEVGDPLLNNVPAYPIVITFFTAFFLPLFVEFTMKIQSGCEYVFLVYF